MPGRRAPPPVVTLLAAVTTLLAAGLCGCGAGAAHPTAPTVTRTALVRTVAIHRTPQTARRPDAETTASGSRTRTPAPPPRTAARPARRTSGPVKPRIVWDPVPFGAVRKAQTVAYTRRHYGSFLTPTWRLTDPHVIVIHYTESSYSSAFNTFANDVPDSELHELPATSAHFIVDSDGTIHQLVSVGTIARHTVGLNWTALGIEHVGYSDAQVLGDAAQMRSSLHLVQWLRCRFHIPVADVIGHNESLSSPYHHEDEPALRHQTHSDFVHADMQIYRRRLRALGAC
ncbi:MAG TPA: N-acetylmuramoyl-L-alanine amidase [Solirubrobacteraceae bacterium]|nr:N-acetylmuramoyl-L-alanine amidase [Solirubrobacteraceae bacterium]